VPSGPALEIFVQQLGCEGPMARTVTDLAMLLSTQAGFYPRAPLAIEQDPVMLAGPVKRDFKGTRLAWLGDWGGYLPVEPGVLELCGAALKVFEDMGCVVEEANPDYPPERLWETWLKLRHWLAGGNLSQFYNTRSSAS
jgi:amidase